MQKFFTVFNSAVVEELNWHLHEYSHSSIIKCLHILNLAICAKTDEVLWAKLLFLDSIIKWQIEWRKFKLAIKIILMKYWNL